MCIRDRYPTGEAEGFKIKKSKIRGVESLGMLCAEDEIGIGTSHDGIIVLPNDVPAGTPARDYYQIEDDYLLEIGLTPNRADAMSHYGVARDLAVYLVSYTHLDVYKRQDQHDQRIYRRHQRRRYPPSLYDPDGSQTYSRALSDGSITQVEIDNHAGREANAGDPVQQAESLSLIHI